MTELLQVFALHRIETPWCSVFLLLQSRVLLNYKGEAIAFLNRYTCVRKKLGIKIGHKYHPFTYTDIRCILDNSRASGESGIAKWSGSGYAVLISILPRSPLWNAVSRMLKMMRQVRTEYSMVSSLGNSCRYDRLNIEMALTVTVSQLDPASSRTTLVYDATGF